MHPAAESFARQVGRRHLKHRSQADERVHVNDGVLPAAVRESVRRVCTTGQEAAAEVRG